MSRVRFAPSPTGNLHIGSVRTALFNWVYAKRYGGELILRIEDTDFERSKPEFEENIFEGLTWLGLDFDESPLKPGAVGPYRQSERIDAGIYKRYAEKLIESGHAYYCFDTPEELEQERAEAQENGVPYVYSGKGRLLDASIVEANLASGMPYTIRFHIPEGRGDVVIPDLVRGEVSFDSELQGDFVIMKSDGAAAYNFAVVIDDIEMNVSCIIRGEDHISNTPRQILVFEALGAKVPDFAHLPMILGPDRSKLSKRHGAQSVSDYRNQGYLADALINYLSLLGWSPKDTQEIFSRDEIVKEFNISKISKSGAIFDTQKLRWMNGQYIRALSPTQLFDAVQPFLSDENKKILDVQYSKEQQLKIIECVQESLFLLTDVNESIGVFTQSFADYKTEVQTLDLASIDTRVPQLFADALDALSTDVTESWVEETLAHILAETGLGKGKVFRPIRMIATAKMSGSHLPVVLALLGKTVLKERANYVRTSQSI